MLTPTPGASAIATLGHLSDLHATRVRSRRLAPLFSKRGLGWLSWQAQRRHHYRPVVLEALLEDLRVQAPDQIAVTGDLTQIALVEEFREAADWLERIGPPERVSAVPGNHDAYVRVPHTRGWGRWSAYLESDASGHPALERADAPYPSVRVRDGLALVGVCSARPTGPLSATGRVGARQLARLARILEGLRDSGLCRVVLIHHPPLEGVTHKRRSLTDARGFAEVLRRHGAELVLHGHLHRAHEATLPGPDGQIPVFGVPSASHAGPSPERCAAYQLYEIERDADGRVAIRRRMRGWDPATRRVIERDVPSD